MSDQRHDKPDEQKAIEAQRPVGAYLCDGTEKFAAYWKKGAWNEPVREDALTCMERAVNGWKNLAYSLAQSAHYQLLRSSPSHVRPTTDRVDADPPQPSLYDRRREETMKLAYEVLRCSIPDGEGRQAIMWAKRFANELLSAPSATVTPSAADRAKLLMEWNALVSYLEENFTENNRSMRKARQVHELIVKMVVTTDGGNA